MSRGVEAIEGRTTDFVVATDGTIMHGLALIYILRDLDWVAAFKIVQESLFLTRVEVVLTSGKLNKEQCALIVSGFKKRLGESVDIEVEQLSEISPEKSGKYRYVISKVTG